MLNMEYCQQGLHGISPDTRIKLKLLSVVMSTPITRLVELMTDRLWEEKQDLVSKSVPQNRVNKETRKILESMRPK